MSNTGTIAQVIGPVVDVDFSASNLLPKIYEALEIQFNVNGVDKDKLTGDPRFPFGIPRPDSANYLWIQQFYAALTAIPALAPIAWNLVIIACLTAFSFALEPLGFLLSAIPLMLLLLRAIDPVRWTLAIPLAVLAPLGVWWVLKHALLIQLPSGIFEIG